MADLIQVDMGKVGQLVGRDDGIDNRRAVNLERFVDLGL